MKFSTVRRMVLAAAALASAGAGATVFPDKDASHDFTSPAAWGTTALPGNPSFNASATLVAGQDASFTGYFDVYGGADVTFDLTATPSRAISMTQRLLAEGGSTARFLCGHWTTSGSSGYSRIGSYASTHVNNTMIFSNAQVTCEKDEINGTGNRMIFTGKDASLACTYTGTYDLFTGGKSNVLWLTDGATWTHNAAALYTAISGGPADCVFRIDDGATFSTTKAFYVGYNPAERRNRVEVGTGGALTAGSVTLQRTGQELIVSNGTFKTKSWLGHANAPCNCRFALQGPNARYDFGWPKNDTFPIWNQNGIDGCVVEVTDGATWEFNTNSVYLTIGGAVSNCTFRMARKGKYVMKANNLFVGYNNVEYGNRLEVVDDGELEMAGSIFVQKNGQSVTVRDGKVSCYSLVFSGAKDCAITLAGTNAVLTQKAMTNQMFPGSSNGDRFVITDGATLTHTASSGDAYYTSISDAPHDNTLSITRGGKFVCPKGFYFGYNKDHDNCVEVFDGGSITSSYVSVGGVDNHLTVSNGTILATTSTKSGINIGYAWGSNNTNALLTVAGTNSQLRTTGNFQLACGATIDFRIPKEGYAATPITLGVNLNIYDGTHITVEAEEFQNTLSKRTDIVLATGSTGYSISQAVIDEANVKLAPKRMALRFDKAPKQQLVLTVKPRPRGLAIVVW